MKTGRPGAYHRPREPVGRSAENPGDHPKDLEVQQTLQVVENAMECYRSHSPDEAYLRDQLFRCAQELHSWPEIYLSLFRERGVLGFVLDVVMDTSLCPETLTAALHLLNNFVYWQDEKPPIDLAVHIIERAVGLLPDVPGIAPVLINNLLRENGPLAEVFVENWFDAYIDMMLDCEDPNVVKGLAALIPLLSLRDFPLPLHRRIRIFDALEKMMWAKALWQFADSIDLLLDFSEPEITSKIYSGFDVDLYKAAVKAPCEPALSAVVRLLRKMPEQCSIAAIPYAELGHIAKSDEYAMPVRIHALQALIQFVRIGRDKAVTDLSREFILGDILDYSSTMTFDLKVATARLALVSMRKGSRDQRRALAQLGLHRIAFDVIESGEVSLVHDFVRVVRHLLRDEQAGAMCLSLLDALAAAANALGDEHWCERDELFELVQDINDVSPY